MINNKEYLWNLSELKNIKNNGLKVFSCFSCGGGSSMGYKLAGFDVIGNNEIDTKINNIYVKNLNPKYTFNFDIRDMVKIEIPKELYNIDILDGSPPCSAFSMVGLREKVWGTEKKFKEGQKLQRMDDLFFPFLDFAERIKPKVIVAENIKGIIQKRAQGYVNKILNRLENIGYETQMFLLNSALMGVPQTRERVFFISRRKDLKLSRINLDFKESPILYGEIRDKENFKPIKKETQTYYLWKNRKPQDNSLKDTIVRLGGKPRCYSEKYLKDEKVFSCLTSRFNGIIYNIFGRPCNKDIITVQTFPQDYDFCGYNVEYLCGMSVPPIMMKKIAEQIYLQLFKDKEGQKV